MVEQVGCTVLEKIVEWLVDPIIRQFSYLFFYNRNIKSLKDGIVDLNDEKGGVTQLVEAADRNLDTVAPEVGNWLKNVEEAEIKAKKVLDGTNAVTNGCMNGWCPNIKQRYLLSRKAVKQSGDIKELRIKGEKYAPLIYPKLHAGKDVPSTSSANSVETSESRVAMTKEVMEALKKENISTIGICGLGGIGKTKMAKEIRDKVKVEKLFDEVAMTVVSQNQDLKKIQGELANMLDLTLEENDNIEDRGNRLRQRLRKGGRILVILDDLWEELDLDEIGIPVRGQGESDGCKVLMTSREEHVCIIMGTDKIFPIQLLSNEEAWDLFKKKAGDSVMNADLHQIARKVLNECGRLPLAIITVATTLKPWGKHVWEDAHQQLNTSTVTSIPGMDRKVYSSLRLSYDFLTRKERSVKKEECNQLQQLFLLCCLFPEDFNIPVEILVRYTIGLGFFNGDQHLEYARLRVQSLTDQLKSCYLLLPCDKDWHVKMHDVVRDFGLIEASSGKHMYFSRHDVQSNEWPLNDEVKSYTAISIGSRNELELPLDLEYPSLQLLHLSGKGSVDISRDYFRAMQELRVVFFKSKLISFRSENMLLESQPKALEFFMNVQTLCLVGCRFGTDIGLIGSMRKLKILSFDNCEIDVLPSEIGQLNNLKLLDLRRTRFRSTIPGVLSCLTKLEELYTGEYFHDAGFAWERNEEECASITELYSLSGLKTLQVYLKKEEELLKLKDFSFGMLKRFDIIVARDVRSYYNYYFLAQLKLEYVNLNLYQGTEFVGLLRRAEVVDLRRVNGLKNIMKEANKDGFMNLKKLIIDDNEDMVEICEGNLPRGALGMLERLRLHNLLTLRHLWRGPVKDPSLVNLKDVRIFDCHEIVNLFSWSTARCLVQLEELTVRNCMKLEEIISKDENLTKMIEFPKLEIVKLRKLPSFERFVAVSFENNFSRSIFSQVLLPSVEMVDVRGIGNSMEALFDMGEIVDILNKNGAKGMVFGQLKSIYIDEQNDLRQIWKNVPKQGFQGFHKLERLELYNCKKIEYLLPVSIAKLLVNLEEIELANCMRMEQVIKMNGEEEGIIEKMDKIVFPQLRTLHFRSVGLKVFCQSNHDLEFPKLESLFINDCPNMNIFCSGSLSTPKLMSVKTRSIYFPKYVWKGDLNKTIRCLYERSQKEEEEVEQKRKRRSGEFI